MTKENANNDSKTTQTQSSAVIEFNSFLNKFAEGNSYVLNIETNLFQDKNNLTKTYEEYCEKSQEKVKDKLEDKSFNDVVSAIKEREGVNRDMMIDIINHAVWLWALPNNRKTTWVSLDGVGNKKGKKNSKEANNTTGTDTSKNNNKYNDELLKIKGVAGGGSGYVQTKTNGVRFILYLFNQIKNNENISEIKQKLIGQCKVPKDATYNDKYTVPDGVKNLLLHLCDSENYEPIAASADKDKIVKAFEDFVEFTDEDVDSKIKQIREYLEKQNAFSKGASFYSNSLPLMWKGESTTDLSLLQKLEYKKAMILYGPPGTGKTYTAMELAKEMIVRHFMKECKEAKNSAEKAKKAAAKAQKTAEKAEEAVKKAKKTNSNILKNKEEKAKEAANALSVYTQALNEADKALSFCFNLLKNIEKEEEKQKYISYLQFHINYNYEDFIAGQVINGKSIETKPGFIFDVINKARKHSDIPYVVILDEINRTDISRVFGELFTAIEKRGEDVTLTLPKPLEKKKAEDNKANEKERLVLNLPDNIYFIGTMNEIDFSLERVDFALRRRFIWELLDYSEDSLESIINYRLKHYPYEEWFRYYKRQGKSPEEAKELAKSCLGNSKKVVTDSEIDSEKNFVEQRIKTFQGAVNEVYNKYLDGFCISCTNLNKKVAEAMGEEYHIGHAFFAEIANLYIELIQNAVNKPWNTAKKILWEISIKPTLEAYCGTMDRTEKEKYLKGQGGKFYEAFFGKENPEDD